MQDEFRYNIQVFNPSTDLRYRGMHHDKVKALTRQDAIDIALSRCLANGIDSPLEGKHYVVDLYPHNYSQFLRDIARWGD